MLTSSIWYASTTRAASALRPAPSAAADCQFILGFQTLHDLIPDRVGPSKTGEYHDPQNEDNLQ